VSLAGVVDQELAMEMEEYANRDAGDSLVLEATSLRNSVQELEVLTKLRIKEDKGEGPVKKLMANLSTQLRKLHGKSKNLTLASWKDYLKCKANPNISKAAKAVFSNVSAGYKQCKWEEQSLELNVVQCRVEIESIEEMRSAEKEMKKAQGKLMVGEKVCKTAYGEDYESQLKRLVETWDNAYRSLAASQKPLPDKKKSLAVKRAKCNATTKLHEAKVKVCKTVASKMDKAKCEVAGLLSKECKSYRKCYHKAKTSYELLVTDVKQTLNLIKDQLNALTRISCLIKADKDVEKLKACQDMEDEKYEDLDIKFETPGDGFCYEETERPCNLAYITVYYEGKAELCTPCVGPKGKLGK